MRLYIAGPMTGHPEFNYPAFHAAEADLTAKGYRVLNPARRRINPAWTWLDYMREALTDLAVSDGVAALPGWDTSRGARIELRLARDLDLPHMLVEDWLRLADGSSGGEAE